MKRKQLLILSELVVDKLSKINDYSAMEKTQLKGYVKDLMELQNTDLITIYAENIVAIVYRGLLFRIEDELSKNSPDLDKLREMIKFPIEWTKNIVGTDHISDYLTLSNEAVEHDLKTLASEMEDFVVNAPKVSAPYVGKTDFEKALEKEKSETEESGDELIKEFQDMMKKFSRRESEE